MYLWCDGQHDTPTMPAILLERLPLPSLRSYVSFSVLVLALATFYAHQTVRTKMNFNPDTEVVEELGLPPELANITLPYSNDEHFYNLMYVMRVETWCIWVRLSSATFDVRHEGGDLVHMGTFVLRDFCTSFDVRLLMYVMRVKTWCIWVRLSSATFDVRLLMYVMRVETWCIWTLVNTCYCLLILLGKLIQNIVFGELRVSEQQHLKDKFWNFVFYKFIFIFGVMNVQSMEEVVLWVAWFSALGFLHLLTQVCKDRFEYLSFSPATPRVSHVKLLSLLTCIFTSCCVLLAASAWVALHISLTICAFLGAECFLLLLKCLYVMLRLLSRLCAVELHGNIFLSMASLVICMQLRFLFYEFQRRIKRHKNYLKVVKDMEAKSAETTVLSPPMCCLVCSNNRSPSPSSCLRSWLEQDTSCPTCRTALSETPQGERNPMGPPGAPNVADGIVPPAPQGTTNHFFHFDGSRYVSWLPSFSVEVTHTNLLPGQQAHATQTSQLDNMAREVQVVFPSIPQQVIMEDLRVTRSVDQTIDNILEGRLIVPQVRLAVCATGETGCASGETGCVCHR
ncbi:E3 ubiquitin-protein ligase AMFR [Aplysia californica]|uniref:E3 ubiquitin-protein ligase AMFR n=1 Tax=Aplysia californica TaxID=6500 RepID=A0ABM1W4D1_APLCA|nr:E3 ubiquitin-protein ligase AMFR [Aplysia californica]